MKSEKLYAVLLHYDGDEHYSSIVGLYRSKSDAIKKFNEEVESEKEDSDGVPSYKIWEDTASSYEATWETDFGGTGRTILCVTEVQMEEETGKEKDEEPLSPPATPEEISAGQCSWCQHCTNEGCCLHGTDALVEHCSNYKEEKHGT